MKMNIVHISTNAPYNDGWGYQENLLPKYHCLLGHQVTLIVSTLENHDGKIVDSSERKYKSIGGFDVIRKHQIKSKIPFLSNVLISLDVYDLLVDLKPDVIFYHGFVSTTIFQVCKYKKMHNKSCVVIQDNHMDYNIGYDKKRGYKDRIRILVYRFVAKATQKYVDKVYGVTPWRKDYAVDVFGVDSSKADVLIMGADDEEVHLNDKRAIREKIRHDNQINEGDFLIVSGGKLSENKKIIQLMDAVKDIKGVILLIFGTVEDDIREQFQQRLFENIKYVGWIPANRVYDYFFAADLVCFPGQHSVLWEQACASKVPCLFAKWPGMNHVDNGGNSAFFDTIDSDAMCSKIRTLLNTPEYFEMKTIAESECTDIYMYSKIASKSIADFKTEEK